MPLLSVQNLRTSFHTRNGIVRAVDGVSFDIEKGQTLGIVGESGSGKSVTCYSLLGLIPQPPGKIEEGKALFDGRDLLAMSEKELRTVRGKRVSMIFQDPMTSLNPFMRIQDQITEPLIIHDGIDKETATKRAIQALEEVGVPDAPRRIRQYPHEFSGGMRQRVMIAMALITNPELLIADEPTTALDVTVQAQVLELIKEMQRKHGTAVILISHDLGVVAGFVDKVNVMYAGRVVESGPTREVYYHSKHPYNEALQRSIPALQTKGQELYTIPGAPPDLARLGEGCAFAPRCAYVQDACRSGELALKGVAENHESACRRVQDKEIELNAAPA